MGRTLRVASYNVRDLKDDGAAAARVVRAISPDVLCLQEVPRHPLSRYRIASFANRCGLYWSGSHGGSGGTTILSALGLDVANTEHIALKVDRLQRQRGYAVCRVQMPGRQSVDVVSIHLSLDAGERVRHATVVLETLAGHGPLVVAGDLNEGSDGLAWTSIARRLLVVTPDAPTFPAGRPRHRLDVIFASPDLEVQPRGPIELEAEDLVAATDHLPVWVDLSLPRLTML